MTAVKKKKKKNSEYQWFNVSLMISKSTQVNPAQRCNPNVIFLLYFVVLLDILMSRS